VSGGTALKTPPPILHRGACPTQLSAYSSTRRASRFEPTFFYFDDNPGRRAINKRMKSEAAEQAAKAYAKVQRDGPPEAP
jgi:hypothetical protein